MMYASGSRPHLQNNWKDVEDHLNEKFSRIFHAGALHSEERCTDATNIHTKRLIKRSHTNYVLRNCVKVQRHTMILHENIRKKSDGYFHLIVIDLANSGITGASKAIFYDMESFNCYVAHVDRKTMFRARFLRATIPFQLVRLPQILEKNHNDWHFSVFGKLTPMKCPEQMIVCMDLIGLTSKDFSLKQFRYAHHCTQLHSKGIINTFLYPNVEYYQHVELRPLRVEEYSEESKVSKKVTVALDVQRKIDSRKKNEQNAEEFH